MTLTIFTDGGSRGNPGQAAVGVVVKDGENTIFELGKSIGVASNNVAEYTAVLEAVTYLASLPSAPQKVNFYLDSLLVVQQLKGVYKIKHPDMKALFDKIQPFLRSLPSSVSFSHIPRAQNARADALVNQALDALN